MWKAVKDGKGTKTEVLAFSISDPLQRSGAVSGIANAAYLAYDARNAHPWRHLQLVQSARLTNHKSVPTLHVLVKLGIGRKIKSMEQD